MFFRLLLESFRRQRRRKLLAGAAILLGTTAVTAMLALATTIGDRIHRELAVYGANIVMTPEADALAVNIGGVNLKPATGNAYLHESDLQKLRGIFWANNITAVSPELRMNVDLDQREDLVGAMRQGGTFPALGLWFRHADGDAQRTTGALAMHPWWKVEGRWPTDGTMGELAIGARLQNKLQLSTLNPLTLNGQSFTITGVFSTGDSTEDQVLLPISAAQHLANLPNAVDRVEISARTRPEDAFARKDPDTLSPKQRDLWYCRPYANSIAYQIREAIPGANATQLRQVEQSEGNILSRISGLLWLISAAALLAAGFAVSAAMATAILERRGEIGLMRSLGASRGSIALLFYVESAILALLAGTGGYLLGSLLSAWLGARIFSSGPTPSLTSPHALTAILNPVLLPIVLALALAVALAGSSPSIRTALRLDPSHVLRSDA